MSYRELMNAGPLLFSNRLSYSLLVRKIWGLFYRSLCLPPASSTGLTLMISDLQCKQRQQRALNCRGLIAENVLYCRSWSCCEYQSHFVLVVRFPEVSLSSLCPHEPTNICCESQQGILLITMPGWFMLTAWPEIFSRHSISLTKQKNPGNMQLRVRSLRGWQKC